jgi:hypothetical protein
VNIKNFLEKFSLNDFPIGLGGCKNSERSYECCEYNITIFDGKKQEDSIKEFENEFVKIHHASLNETNSNILIQFHEMKIILDEQWELQMLLSKIKGSKEKIFNDYAKNCLFDSLFCLTKSENGIKSSDPFASSWQKCAAFFIADAISILNSTRPSPTHMLDYIRDFKKNRISEKFSIINQCIGIERATPSLLSRMCKSTIGFSDMIEKNNHSKIIQAKYDYLVQNSLLSDCYFYLGYINRNNILKIKDSIHRKPELIHILKVGFDIENDSTKAEQNIKLLRKATNDMVNSITSA